MKLNGKCILSAVFALASAAAIISFKPAEGYAATTSEINDSSVFVKQLEHESCTLCANVMMLRRAALLRGDSDWSSITESSARASLWCWAGMYCDYTYKGFTVTQKRFSYDVKSQLIALLKEHPEGIVAYDYDYPHAVLVTDYTNGEFYIAEPANNVSPGRIKASQALFNIQQSEAYWYITNASLKVTDGEKQNEDTIISQRWKVTASSGLNLRSGAGTSYESKAVIPCGKILSVTQTVSDGVNKWGYVSYQSQEGWISLNYAKRVSSAAIGLTSSISTAKVTLGSSIKIKASASGGSGSFQYAYYYKKNSSSNWIRIKNYSNSKIVTYQPLSATDYTILIKAKDSKGQVAEKKWSISVRKPLTNTSAVSAQKTYTGKTLTLNGASYGGFGSIQYAYYFKRPSDNNWVTIKGYSASKKVGFVPLTAAEYSILIKAKDENGNISKKTFKVVVKRALTNTSSVSASKVRSGSAVAMNGSAVGGSGSYQYAYYYRTSASSSWTAIQKYSKSTSVLFMPAKSGEYELLIKVKDSEDTIAKKVFNLTVTK